MTKEQETYFLKSVSSILSEEETAEMLSLLRLPQDTQTPAQRQREIWFFAKLAEAGLK